MAISQRQEPTIHQNTGVSEADKNAHFTNYSTMILASTDAKKGTWYYRRCRYLSRWPQCKYKQRWKRSGDVYIVQETQEHVHDTDKEIYKRGLPSAVNARAHEILDDNPAIQVTCMNALLCSRTSVVSLVILL